MIHFKLIDLIGELEQIEDWKCMCKENEIKVCRACQASNILNDVEENIRFKFSELKERRD